MYIFTVHQKINMLGKHSRAKSSTHTGRKVPVTTTVMCSQTYIRTAKIRHTSHGYFRWKCLTTALSVPHCPFKDTMVQTLSKDIQQLGKKRKKCKPSDLHAPSNEDTVLLNTSAKQRSPVQVCTYSHVKPACLVKPCESTNTDHVTFIS